ncbi:hypothetical protein NMY22_g2062 [Coprinellus aureogranulatus]|nr:hypothetical protein NMY22_g2062 [Coprinellus aureogranulatus]
MRNLRWTEMTCTRTDWRDAGFEVNATERLGGRHPNVQPPLEEAKGQKGRCHRNTLRLEIVAESLHVPPKEVKSYQECALNLERSPPGSTASERERVWNASNNISGIGPSDGEFAMGARGNRRGSGKAIQYDEQVRTVVEQLLVGAELRMSFR